MDAAVTAEIDKREGIAAIVRLALGVTFLLGGIALLGWLFRTELEHFGHWFVGTLGPFGMVLGSFLADGVHFPLPPQFFLLTALAGGSSLAVAFASVLLGSVAGGLFAFTLGRRAAGARWLERRTRASRSIVERLVRKRGLVGVAIAGLLPISFCVLCSLAGVMRLPLRAYAVLAAMRVPRLLVTYAIIVLAWGAP